MSRATTPFAALLLAGLAGCSSQGGTKPQEPVAIATVHLGDGFTILNDSGAPVCVTGVLLEGAGPAQPLYEGMLAGMLEATRPAPPLDGKLLRLRFAASGPQFDAHAKVDGGATFTEWQSAADAAAAGLPEIPSGPGVAEFLLGTDERDPQLGPLEMHVVRRGEGLAVVTKAKRVKLVPTGFEVEDRGDSVAMYRIGTDVPLLVQRCEAGARPCLHPLMAPDLDGALTEFSPDHHHHQTGVFFGVPELNGESWFHRSREGAFQRVENWRDGNFSASARATSKLRWSVSDDWLGNHGPVLTETQRWELTDEGDSYVLDLRWTAIAKEELKVAEHDYGGLFVRMPWTQDGGGHALNSEGQQDAACEGQRARWVDVEVPVPGRKDGKQGHIAVLDHPLNPGHPLPFRVDDQYGFGPSRARLGAFVVPVGKTMIQRYRLIVYLGEFNRSYVEATWKEFAATR